MNDSTRSSSPPGASPDGDTATAQDKIKDAGGQAQEKAQKAAGKVQDTVQQQVDQRTSQAGEKVSGTADDVRSVAEELRKQGKDGPAKLADQAAEQAEKVGSYLSGTGPEQMLHDVEDFGRRQPWALLAGGLVAGAVAARFLKASSRSRYQGRVGGGSGSAGGYKGGAGYASPGNGSRAQIPSNGGTQPPPPPSESIPGAGIGATGAAAPVPETTGSPVVGP
jgi:hypothetical protein